MSDETIEIPTEEFDFCKLVPAHKQTWLQALRTGNYKQGQGHLRQSNGEDVFCCLGVLQDVIQPEDWVKPESFEKDDAKIWSVSERDMYDCAYDAPSLNDGEIQERLMEETNFDSEAMQRLIGMNDGEVDNDDRSLPRVGMKSFAQIADWIEEHL